MNPKDQAFAAATFNDSQPTLLPHEKLMLVSFLCLGIRVGVGGGDGGGVWWWRLVVATAPSELQSSLSANRIYQDLFIFNFLLFFATAYPSY